MHACPRHGTTPSPPFTRPPHAELEALVDECREVLLTAAQSSYAAADLESYLTGGGMLEALLAYTHTHTHSHTHTHTHTHTNTHEEYMYKEYIYIKYIYIQHRHARTRTHTHARTHTHTHRYGGSLTSPALSCGLYVIFVYFFYTFMFTYIIYNIYIAR